MSARASMPFRPYGLSLLGHLFGLMGLVWLSTLSAPHLFVGGVSIVLPPPGSGPGAARPADSGAAVQAPEPAPPEPVAPPPEERRRPQPEQNIVQEPSPDGTLPPPKGDIPSLRPEARDPAQTPDPPVAPTPPARTGGGSHPGSGEPGGTSGVGEGTGIGVEGGVLGAHAPWYLVAVHDKIKSNWDFPAMIGREGEVQAVYRFRIHEDGRVTHVEAARKSSVMAYDMAAHRAILSAAPLPPVPEDLGHQEIVITVTFTKVY